MELQALANTDLKTWKLWILRFSQLLSQEGLLLMGLAFALPSTISLSLGAAFSLIGTMLILWVQGYTEKAIVGPYRFVRHPKRLALWLLVIGFAIGCRSFPAAALGLILLPCLFFLEATLKNEEPDLRTYRYRYHVPALLPTLVPFKKDAESSANFSWRRALFLSERSHAYPLLLAVYGWTCLLALHLLILPPWANLAMMGVWILGMTLRRLLLGRKNRSFPKVWNPH